jgi:restriction system protein
VAVFEHNVFCDPNIVNDYPHSDKCVFCQELMAYMDIEDLWGAISHDKILRIQAKTEKFYKKYHGLEDCYLKLRLDTIEEEVWLGYCNYCGWWKVMKNVNVCAEQWQIWDMYFGLSGRLKAFDVKDISQPISDISAYLTAKYEDRFEINPKTFEDVVASVFKNIGYNTVVTGYCNDGGIDVVLNRDGIGEFIGVQVKRYKAKIKAEQIRALAGALILAGHKKGLFVTTSDFHPGAIKAALTYSSKTLPIELLNADRFYDALKIAAKTEINFDYITESIKKQQPQLYQYPDSYPRNSL